MIFESAYRLGHRLWPNQQVDGRESGYALKYRQI